MKISDKFHLEDINKLKHTVLTGKTEDIDCLLYTSPSPRDLVLSRMPSSA